MIATEKTTADKIRSRVNRQAVQTTLTSLLEYLKTYRELPENGLILWWSSDRCFPFVPPIPNNKRIYRCDKRFDTDLLRDIIAATENADSYGLLISTGDEYALAVAGPLTGRARVLTRSNVYIRNRHGRGGQSSVRFERLANESRATAYSTIVNECRRIWLGETGRPTIQFLVIVAPDEARRLITERMRLEAPLLASCIVAGSSPAASNLIEDGLAKGMTLITAHADHIAGNVGHAQLEEWLRTDIDRLIFGRKWVLKALQDGVVEFLCITPTLHEELRDNVEQAGTVIEMRTGLENYDGLVALAYKGAYMEAYVEDEA